MTTVDMYACRTCKKVLPDNCYTRHVSGCRIKDCKACRNAGERERRLRKGIYLGIRRPKSVTQPTGKRPCVKCGTVLPLDAFQNGVGWCRKCRSEKEALRRLNSGASPRKKYQDSDTTKECRRCGKIKPHSEYGAAKRGACGLVAYCKACVRIRSRAIPNKAESMRAWRKNNLAKAREGHRIRQFRRRLRKAGKCDPGSSIKEHDLSGIMSKTVCVYCLENITRNCRTLEHLVPLCRGGRHVIDNADMACRSCNSRKAGRTPLEFFQYVCERINEGASVPDGLRGAVSVGSHSYPWFIHI